VILADSIGQHLLNSSVKVPDELWEARNSKLGVKKLAAVK
jgi:hypothetical protein